MIMCVHIFQGALDYLMKLIPDNMSNEVKVSYMCYQEKQKVRI